MVCILDDEQGSPYEGAYHHVPVVLNVHCCLLYYLNDCFLKCYCNVE